MKIEAGMSKERTWVIDAITKSYECVIFQHEKDRLDKMLARYVGQYEISEDELKDDITFLDKMN